MSASEATCTVATHVQVNIFCCLRWENPQALAMFPVNLDSQMTSKGIQGCCLSDAYGTQEVDMVPFDWDPNISQHWPVTLLVLGT